MAVQRIKINEFPHLDNIEGSELLPLGRATDGNGVQVTMQEFKDWIGFEQFTGVLPQKATSTSLVGAAGVPAIYIGNAGTYTLNGAAPVNYPEAVNYFFWDGSNWSVLEVPIEVENKIETWTAGTYVQGDQRLHNGQIWSVDVASTTEEPGTGTDWVLLLDGGGTEEVDTGVPDGERELSSLFFQSGILKRIMITNPDTVVNANFQLSEMVEILQGEVQIDISFFVTSSSGLAGYDENQNIVWRVNSTYLGVPNDTQVINKVLDIPLDVKYIDFSTRIDATNSVILISKAKRTITFQDAYDKILDLEENNQVNSDHFEGLQQDLVRSGFRLNSSQNNIQGDSGWAISKFIKVLAGDILKYELFGGGGSPAIVQYDNMILPQDPASILLSYPSGANQNTKGEIEILQDGFILSQYIIVNNPLPVSLNVFRSGGFAVDYAAESIKADVDNLWRKWTVDDNVIKTSYIDGYFLLSVPVGTGAYDDLRYNSDYISSLLIDVNEGDVLLVSGFFGGGNGVAGFDADGNYVVRITPSMSDQQVIEYPITIPSGVSKITVSTRSSAINEIKWDNKFPIRETDAEEILSLIGESDNKKEEKEEVVLSRPDFMEIHFRGSMPIDASPTRTPTSLEFDFVENGKIILSANCELSIQGHGSAEYDKKGYSLDILNASGEELSVKFGDMVSVDGYHLKAHATDRTHTRDVGCGRLWRDMVRQLDYPSSKVNNKPFSQSANPHKNEIYTAEAKYHTDGIPSAVYLNGDFYGLYTLRLKKARDNYAIYRDNFDMIYLDSSTYTAYLNSPFDYTDWEVRDPRLPNYDEQGPVTDPTVLANINRLFDFTSQLSTRFAEHADYINLDHWVLWIIHAELISNRDTNGNNYNIITWNATQWSIIPYDMDNTIGLNPWNTPPSVDPQRNNFDINYDIWGTFKTVYETEIKQIYTMLRNSGFLDIDNLMSYFINISKYIPREVYDDDRDIWPLIWDVEPSLDQIEYFLKGKRDFLDSEWLLP